MQTKDPTHLGDGAYAGHDGHQLWLGANHHENMTVALESEAFSSLARYADAHLGWVVEPRGKPDVDCAHIPGQLVAIHTALVEKTCEQPFVEPMLTCNTQGEWRIRLTRDYHGGDYHLETAKGETPAECLAHAFALIEDMPDPETKAQQDWRNRLARLLDEGHALALPDEVMQPLRKSEAAMTSNLLPPPSKE